ncbi:NAD(P)H-binding protein [uncultured Cellulomonas sp.]|uniref:SDR family oxidoreductase n=1 Tax=uncultured Cellulomonas sp. TaxID=189682 RepID=UPI0028E244FF|nr:NAD(P)H-binding protein [uncultured Cellulomonas sp.]
MADDERPVLVTGGTGTLGRTLVRTLLDAGRPVRLLSRRGPTPAAPAAVDWVVGDLRTGDGVREAVDGVAAVVHCASAPRHPDHDLDAAVQLLLAARAAAVPHLVYISIVGVDRVPFPLYRAKHRVEEIIEDGGVPWTTLRATQFHDFVAGVLDALSRAPVAIAPAGVSDQPVDVREVATRLVELVDAGPSGRVDDLGGPEVLTTTDLMRTYLAVTGRRRPVWTAPVPGLGGFRRGDHLTPAHAVGRVTFAEWLGGVSSRTGRTGGRPGRA